jgi:hypothetical protein
MNTNDLVEFIAMLLIEKKAKEDDKFYDYFIINSDKESFNKRYGELLDNFLNLYAINKTEKSD